MAAAGRPSGIAGPARPTEFTGSRESGGRVVEAADSLARRVTAAVTTPPVLHFTPDGWGDLPPDLFIRIASFLSRSDVFNLRCVSRFWQQSIDAKVCPQALDFMKIVVTQNLLRTRLLYETGNIIGLAAWERTGWNPGPIPLLSPETATLLESPCPFWSDRGRVIDTHLLVWIPASVTRTIDGRTETVPVTLANLPRIIPGARYRRMSREGLVQCGNRAPSRGRWLLVTKELVPGSENKSLLAQMIFVRRKRRDVPDAVDIAVALFMKQFCFPGTYLLGSPETYTRCSEVIRLGVGKLETSLDIGGFFPAGLHVSESHWEGASDGVVGTAEVQVPAMHQYVNPSE